MARPTGTVTFLFTDIQGSTALWERAAPAMRAAVASHDEIIRAAMSDRGGVVFSTAGDGFAVAFQRASDALAAALVAQAGLRSSPWPDEIRVLVRIGLHTGEVHERDGDYFGPAVNRAARIMGAAPAGDIVMSATTASLLDPDERGLLIALGSHELRGVPEPVELFGVPGDDGGWSGRSLAAAKLDHVHLPKASSELVGRQAELASLMEHLGRRRLVTLVGPGGVGKTRLALEVALLSADAFRDGVWLVELAAVTEADAVVATLAAAVETRPRDGVTGEAALVQHLHDRSALVVIDNCEHVVDAAAAVIARVMADCPGVSIVATSREALGLDGELVWPVPSLDPDFEGPLLFRARMFEVDASSPPDPGDDELIVQVCRRLDGIPLAIELAAGQTRMMSVAEIVERLEDRFTLLRGSGRARMERHQTLQATVLWSYRLLGPLEQLLFDRFSVFSGGASLDAVTAVCAGGDLKADDTLAILANLVDRSMLLADRSQARTRFKALETLRQFGSDRLEDRGQTSSCRDRHLDYFVDWVERAEAAYGGPRATFAVPDRLEWDNLRAAHQWAIASRDLPSAVTIAVASRGWAANWIRPDHLDWLDETAALAAELGVAVPLVEGGRAGWLTFTGQLDEAILAARRSIHDAPAPDAASTREAWENMAFASYLKGDEENLQAASAGLNALIAKHPPWKDEAFALFMLSVTDPVVAPLQARDHRARLDALAAEVDSPFVDLLARTARVLETVMSQDPAATAALAGPALELAAQVDSTAFADAISGMVAVSFVGTDSPETAIAFRTQLSTFYEARDWGVIWWTLEGLATHWAQRGDLENVAVLLGNLQADGHDSRGAFEDRDTARHLVLDRPEGQALMARGAAMTRDEVVQHCLTQLAQQIGSGPLN